MPELNKANREVCDVDIRILRGMVPFLNFDTANTTTAGISGDSVYAMAKGSRRIAFQNPLEGTMTIEAQVYPFKFFSLFSDGEIESTAAYAEVKTITAVANGELTIAASNGTINDGTIFVYPAGQYGDEASRIPGTFVGSTFTATASANITNGSEYVVGYVVTRTSGVKRISFTNKKIPKDYFITMKTLDKDEEGVLTPFVITAYKASIQRNFELSFSSEGDPATVTLTFDLMEDKDGNVLDMVELDDSNALTTGAVATSVVKGGNSSDVAINGAVGTITAVIKDSSDNTATKVHAIISGDNDTIIVSADADATVGNYTVTLTDGTTDETATLIVVVTAE